MVASRRASPRRHVVRCRAGAAAHGVGEDAGGPDSGHQPVDERGGGGLAAGRQAHGIVQIASCLLTRHARVICSANLLIGTDKGSG